jgi:AcrR family transcriptional regulator
VSTAIDLAEKGGFEAVRLRDVAADADVALGTLYRYFRSKEDLLIAALTMEVEQLELRMKGRQLPGDTPLARVTAFFEAATRGFVRRPRLSRAILRAAASGDRELAEKVAGFHTRVTDMIIAALRGEAFGADGVGSPVEAEASVGLVLEYVWFAALVGWAGGLQSPTEVVEKMNTAAAMILRGAEERT